MKDTFSRPFLLYNNIQHYNWGSKNREAFIPQFLGIAPEKDIPYAELWMGAHSNAPSKIDVEGNLIPLNELIHRFPDIILGKPVAARFDNKLPFLLKVLSAAEPLSIQAHPSKRQAELLHKTDPAHYPDDNHKPEIAIALDSLTVFAGFATYSKIRKTIEKYPEILQFFGLEVQSDIFTKDRLSKKQQIDKIRQLYQSFIHLAQTKTELYEENVAALATRLQSKKSRPEARESLFLKAWEKYGNHDLGLFQIFFLRLIYLRAGEALIINPGLPHAYIKGNIIECMANSDNVIRAGLTPKYQDIPTLTKILDYSPNTVQIIKPETIDNEIQYPAFTPDFSISKITFGSASRKFTTEKKIELLLAVEGNGAIQWGNAELRLLLHKGQSVIIPAAVTEYSIISDKSLSIFKVQVP
ncbi:MAG: mannose-6-phosphate isomerase, class I [Candidatus Marinimicrobia bacterium]|nr:mannose-6-phosphate isomerase, class I [Candidatus Neomarinimicrobiota bacterium]